MCSRSFGDGHGWRERIIQDCRGRGEKRKKGGEGGGETLEKGWDERKKREKRGGGDGKSLVKSRILQERRSLPLVHSAGYGVIVERGYSRLRIHSFFFPRFAKPVQKSGLITK